MLRYREALGLLPRARDPHERTGHRRYDDPDLEAVRFGLELEHRYNVPPAALSFALRALTEREVAEDVRALASRIDRLPDPQTRAAEVDRDRALRWLGRSGMLPGQGGDRGSASRAERSRKAAPRPDPRSPRSPRRIGRDRPR